MTQLPNAQNALETAGVQAARIESLWWFALAVASLVFLAVVVAMLYGAFRRRDPDEPLRAGPIAGREARSITRWVAGSLALTVAILFTFLVLDLLTARGMAALARSDEPLRIRVTGHQWWWEVEYLDAQPSRHLKTANEIHLPVGRAVELELRSSDVIHSLWIPNLAGKRDLIPGHTSTHWLRADEPGEFRGQCAEFCGHQHANMGLVVVAEPPDRFAAWYEGQLLPAATPTDSARARGQEVFLAVACVMCHSVRGTPAGGSVAPDLTHLASRRTIAAGILPNTPGHLAGWITDPQAIKPGVKMPPNQLAPDDLQALLSYLGGLR